MKTFIRAIVYLSLLGTVTGKIPLSPMINITGFFAILKIFLKRKFSINKYLFPLFLLIVYCFLQTLLITPSSLLKYGFYRYDGNLFPSYLPLLFLSMFQIRFNFNKIITYYLIFAVVVISSSIFLFSFSPFKAHNALGGFIAELICIILGVLYYELKVKKRENSVKMAIYLMLLIVSIVLLIKSDSRGSIIAVLFSIVFVFLFPKFRKLVFLLIFLIIFIFELVVAYPIWIHMGEPYSFFAHKTNLLAIQGIRWWTITARLFYLWPRALNDWLISPLFGIGFSKYNDIPYQFYGIKHLLMINLAPSVYNDFHAHNSYFHFLAETGIVGFVLLIMIILSLDRFLQEKLKNSLEAYINMLLLWYLAFASFTEHRFTTPSQAIPFSILLGMAISNYKYRLGLRKMEKLR